MLNQNWAQNQEDAKKCLANAQKEIIKLQKMDKNKASKEYLEIRDRAFLYILLTEEYYLKVFKSFCRKNNFVLPKINEDDFFIYFEKEIQKEFEKYIEKFNPETGNLENWFNHVFTQYRFKDILKEIKEKAHAGALSIEGEQNYEPVSIGREAFGFNFYELLLDISRLITAMYQHGFQGEQIKEAELDYYSMIFTETVSMVAIDNKDDSYLYVHSEEELFRTMWEEFLDFYTENICRTIREISESPLKLYRDLGINQDGRIEISSSALIAERKNKENKYGVKHLKAVVYYAFFKSIGKTCTEGSVSASLSKYKKNYYKKLAKLKELYEESFQQYAGTVAVHKNTMERSD